MKQSQTKTGKTVFHTVMQPLVVLILLQAAILLTFLYLSGIFDQVNSNERASRWPTAPTIWNRR